MRIRPRRFWGFLCGDGPGLDFGRRGHSAFFLCLPGWNTRDGLPQVSVQAVLQTRNGFLWLGTQEGLVRFDGVKFTVFNKKNTPQFRHSDTRALCEGRDGRLWVGTANGLLSYENGVFATHFLNRNPGGDFVSVLFEDAQGTLWIGTSGGGLNRLKNGSFSTFTTREGLSADVVTSVWSDRDGVIWIGTANGLCRMQDEPDLGLYQQGRIAERFRDGHPGDLRRKPLDRHASRPGSPERRPIPSLYDE